MVASPPALIEVRDPDREVRYGVVYALGQIGYEAGAAVPALIEASLFRAEVRADRPGKSAGCSATIVVPSSGERTGDLCWIWFWRKSTNDALYSFNNVPLRPANLSDARYIGSQTNLEIRWAISDHFLAALNLAGFISGTFLQQPPPSKEIVFVDVGLTYRF